VGIYEKPMALPPVEQVKNENHHYHKCPLEPLRPSTIALCSTTSGITKTIFIFETVYSSAGFQKDEHEHARTRSTGHPEPRMGRTHHRRAEQKDAQSKHVHHPYHQLPRIDCILYCYTYARERIRHRPVDGCNSSGRLKRNVFPLGRLSCGRLYTGNCVFLLCTHYEHALPCILAIIPVPVRELMCHHLVRCAG
jgi:hypothetical protein